MGNRADVVFKGEFGCRMTHGQREFIQGLSCGDIVGSEGSPFAILLPLHTSPAAAS
jgi:hypothetical protein